MAIHTVHTFVVHPRKNEEAGARVNGASLKLDGKMFDLLNTIYGRSEDECDIDITFLPAPDGAQQNDCRDLIVEYLGRPTLANGRAIAAMLEKSTDFRSGLGLLFLLAGREGRDHRIIISRFPTDNAIYVDENQRDFTVEFLERVFMKNKASYKAVLYQHASLHAGFWNGRVVDKQLNNPSGDASNYWIAEFLASESTVTPARGTRWLAVALRDAVKHSEFAIKQEITAAATLAPGLAGQVLSIAEFADRFRLSDAARAAIVKELKSPRMAQQRFQFDLAEFRSLVAFKAVALNNGVTLTAPSESFDDVVRKEHAEHGQIRFITEGVVVDEKLKTKA